MKRVVRAANTSYTAARIDRFSKALANVIKVYYQLDEDTQSEIDDMIGSDTIVELEDCLKALSIR